MPAAAPILASRTLLVLWFVVLLETVSPLPLALSIGAIWVLVARPPWFYNLVCELYGRSPSEHG